LGRRKARYLAARFLTPPVEHRTCGFDRIRRNTCGPSPCISRSICFHCSGLHRRSSMFDPISPTYPRNTTREQLAHSLGTLFATYLCTPYFLRRGAFAFSPRPGVRGFPTRRLLCPIRLPAGLWSLRWGLPYLLSTLLRIPYRLSRVRHGGLRRNAVGGVLLTAPSALCGFLVVTRGRSGLPVLSLAMQ
jgi:hypothetical protein